MTFGCNGKHYNSSEMRVHETGDPALPLILITRNYTEVFLVRSDHWKGTSVIRADDMQIRTLAARYKLEDLKLALPKRSRPAGEAGARLDRCARI